MNSNCQCVPDLIETWGDTPGEQYVKKYLDLAQYQSLDIAWVSEAINNGWFVVCECCHFIRLPQAPFPYDAETIRKYGDPGSNGCDVCFSVQEAATLPVCTRHTSEAIENALTDLKGARTERARLFYELWMSSVRGADAVIWNAMRRGIQQVVKKAQRSQPPVAPSLAVIGDAVTPPRRRPEPSMHKKRHDQYASAVVKRHAIA